MANNRLYILNPISKTKTLLAKGYGGGWIFWKHGLPELDEFLQDSMLCDDSELKGETTLILKTEFQLTHEEKKWGIE